MSDAWGAHQAAVANAIDAIGRVQEAISMGTEQCDQATGAILSAVGSTNVESAVNAMQYLQEVKARLDETFAISQQAVEECERYGRGF